MDVAGLSGRRHPADGSRPWRAEQGRPGTWRRRKPAAFRLYIGIAILFGGYIWWAWANGTLVTTDGTNPVASYFQGYIIEKVLSIDNVFVISLIFGYFAIPRKYQYRALVWGIIGVILLRGLMIAIGAELIAAYDWVTLIGRTW